MIMLNKKFDIPEIDYFVDFILKNQRVNFCKLNFSFWYTLLHVENNLNFPKCNFFDTPKGWVDLHGINFLNELNDIIKKLPETNIIFAASTDASPQIKPKEAINNNLLHFILQKFPKNYCILQGWIMKYYAQNNQLEILIQTIADKNDVLLVGLDHTKELEKKFKFKKFIHYELFMEDTKNRIKIKNDIAVILKNMTNPCLVLQAGESLSLWFTYHLLKDGCNFSSFDFGRSLDKWCKIKKPIDSLPDIIDQPWQKFILQNN